MSLILFCGHQIVHLVILNWTEQHFIALRYGIFQFNYINYLKFHQFKDYSQHNWLHLTQKYNITVFIIQVEGKLFGQLVLQYCCCYIVGSSSLKILLLLHCWVIFPENLVVVTLLVIICLQKYCVVVVGVPSGHLVNDWSQSNEFSLTGHRVFIMLLFITLQSSCSIDHKFQMRSISIPTRACLPACPPVLPKILVWEII